MIIILLLIPLSIAVAAAFLGAFIWAVRSGQYEDTCTPAMRMLVEERGGAEGMPPLTLALSQGEREKAAALAGNSESVQTKPVSRFVPQRKMILPLPLGEGRGEGQPDTSPGA